MPQVLEREARDQTHDEKPSGYSAVELLDRASGLLRVLAVFATIPALAFIVSEFYEAIIITYLSFKTEYAYIFGVMLASVVFFSAVQYAFETASRGTRKRARIQEQIFPEELSKRLIEPQKPPQDEGGSQTKFVPEKFHDNLTSFVNSLSSSIARTVGAECSVAIKLIAYPEDGTRPSIGDARRPAVLSLVRDGNSQRTRAGVSPVAFHYRSNSAFEVLVDGKTRDSYFAASNLQLLADSGEYKNSNELWRRYYTSTVVVAITDPTLPLPTFANSNPIVGFLCVDSWYGDVASQQVAIGLTKVASSLFKYFKDVFDAQRPAATDKSAESVASQIRKRLFEIAREITPLEGNSGTTDVSAQTSPQNSNVAQFPFVPARATQDETTAREICDVFRRLVDNGNLSVARFIETFQIRAKLPELAEAQGPVNGLRLVLSDLLRVTPHQRYVDQIGPEVSMARSDFGIDERARWVSNFTCAIVDILEQQSSTVRRFSVNLERTHLPASQHLQALFLMYSDNQHAYPY